MQSTSPYLDVPTSNIAPQRDDAHLAGVQGPFEGTRPHREHVDVLVIGAGQAGLSVGYYLARTGLKFLIVDANQRVGDNWRARWDSLRLFTPAQFDGLDGMPFPAPRHSSPSKDDMAAYLEAYAMKFHLPVRPRIAVRRLSKVNEGYLAECDALHIQADQVVVAMSGYQVPRVPVFAALLRPHVRQLHSSEYKSPAQLQAGPTLVVGAANSGAEIAVEIARSGRATILSGRHPGHLPFDNEGLPARLILRRLLLRGLFHHVLTIRTPMGRRVREKTRNGAVPLIRLKPKHIDAAGVKRAPRVVEVRDGLPVTADGRHWDVANVVWSTGYGVGLGWIDIDILDESGMPCHEGGIVSKSPGLYLVGQFFLYAMSSAFVHGVGRDAKRIVKAVAARAERSRQGRVAR